MNAQLGAQNPSVSRNPTAPPLGKIAEPVIRGRSMKSSMRVVVKFGLLALGLISSIGSASAQADLAKAIQQKLAAEAAKLESSCADDIKKYCSTVTPGEGRMIYCMQAHEDKISPKCAFDLEEAATDVQLSADNLKEAVTACKAEITGVCGTTLPGQGRIAACLMANKTTASKSCSDAIQKIQDMVAAH
jgi:hypothetical protein